MGKRKYNIQIGEIYNNWKVLEINVLDPESKTKNQRKKCLCECLCDKHTKRYLLPLKLAGPNPSKSCGCYNRKITSNRNAERSSVKVGNRYGKLVVIKDLGMRKQNSRNKNERWSLCQCDCGSHPIEVKNNMLQNGSKKSCGCLISSGEHKIKQILEENNINFIQQYSFNDLRTYKNGILKFDFAIFKDKKLDYLIEFDGRQHLIGPEAKWTKSASLEEIQYRDNLKNIYCKKNNITLKRIPFTEFNNINYQNIISNKYDIENKEHKIYNVAADAHDCEPVEIEQIIKDIKEIE